MNENKTDNNKNVAERIKSLRINKDIPQATIALALNLSVTAYNRIENNKTQLTINNLFLIAEALDVGIETLLPLDLRNSVYNNHSIVVTNCNNGSLNFSISAADLQKLQVSK